jgi:hypothetical protein
MDLREIGWEAVNCIHVALGSDKEGIERTGSGPWLFVTGEERLEQLSEH